MCYFGHINLMRVRKKRESERKSGGAEMLRVRTASCVILSKIYVANLSLYRLTTKRCQIHPFWRASSPPSGKKVKSVRKCLVVRVRTGSYVIAGRSVSRIGRSVSRGEAQQRPTYQSSDPMDISE